MQVRFWGVRGQMVRPGAPFSYFGGNTLTIELTAESGSRLLVDAGSGFRLFYDKFVSEYPTLLEKPVNILLTSYRWEHTMGLPFSSLIYDDNCTMRLFGPHSSLGGVQAAMERLIDSRFCPVPKVFSSDVGANISFQELSEQTVMVEDFRLTTRPAQSIQEYGPLWSKVEDSSGVSVVCLTDSDTYQLDDYGFARLVDFCSGAKLVIVHVSEKLPLELVVKLRRASGCPRICMYQYDYAASDKQIHAKLAGFTDSVMGSREGMCIEI